MEIRLDKILVAFIFTFFISCKGEKRDNTNIDKLENDTIKVSEKTIDFLGKKYFSHYLLSIDASTPADHPIFNYLDCKTNTYFTVHFVPKETSLMSFWKNDYFEKYKYEYDDIEAGNTIISSLLKNNYSKYHIFAYKIKNEYIDKTYGCTEESININEKSIADIYLYTGNKKWEHIKTIKNNILPQQANNDFFISNFPNLFQFSNQNNDVSLVGSWSVDCRNGLTILDLNKTNGLLSLYSHNAIYINITVENSGNKNEFILKYSSLSSQRKFNQDKLIIIDEDISKDKTIGKLTILADGKARLDWIGLYNIKKQKLEFVGEDFLLISENGGKLPLILEKCD